MPKRYDNIQKIINDSDQYYDILESKNKNFIEQYPTYIVRPMTEEIFTGVAKSKHVWAAGDKYFSLSAKYYEDPSYWWIIAWFNNKPTEQHISIGETIYIPQPLTKALNYYYGG